MTNNRWASGVAALALTAAMTPAALAQDTTGGIRGSVETETGASISGATVVVVNTETGLARTVRTNSNGDFNVRNLPVNGLYAVSVTAPGFAGERAEDIALSLGNITDLDFDLSSGTGDEIVVVATRTVAADVAVGPNTTFTAAELQSLPTINRSIADVLRLDPRVYIDESRGDLNPVQCAGKNPRFNSFTLDGVRLNDGFGLNANGFPTERQPFSFDAIEQVSVELAPFDVQYGGFSACNINAVTKSGTNEFHGTMFYDYTDNDLRGDSLEGEDVIGADFKEQRYGATVGGPIIKDKLFFFAAYERNEGSNNFDRGALGSGAVNEVDITQDELDRIVQIANEVYDYDPGQIPTSLPNDDEKILIKLDWNINERHRASYTYNYNDGFNNVQSDGDLDEFEFQNHLYVRGSELNQHVGQVFSDWTENFSTELRIGHVSLDNSQNSIGGTDFGEITIETDDVDVYLGGDDSRQRNDLEYDIWNFAAKAFYTVGRHEFTLGYEREQFDIFNLFVQHAETEIDFENIEFFDINTCEDPNDPSASTCDELPDLEISAIDAFELGLADSVFYNNAPSGDINTPSNSDDAAADWGYALNTVYFQDAFELTPTVNVVAGLRYDFYTSDDSPPESAQFVEDYGFSNSQNIDGLDLLQPRIAVTWEAKDNLTVSAGVGRYSGGDPNVWISNNYSNNDVTNLGASDSGLDFSDRFFIDPGTDPAAAAQAALDASGDVSLLDPSVVYIDAEDGVPASAGYAIPEQQSLAVRQGIGSTGFQINYLDPNFELPSEWKFSLGAVYQPTLDLPSFLGGDYTFTADFLYSQGENSAVILRGDLEDTGEVDADGRPIYESVRRESFVLTNSDDEQNRTISISGGIQKEYDNGFNYVLGYAYTDSQDVNPMTSSVAFSNYTNRAAFDPQEQVRSTSDFNIKHRFTAIANYERNFIRDYATRVSAVGLLRSGLAYSIVDPDAEVSAVRFTSPDLLLTPGSRNEEFGSWWGKVDLRFEQEFPGIQDGHKAAAFIVIDNFTNLLNDEWGILREPDFPPTVEITRDDMGMINGTQRAESRVGDASRYQIRVGVRYVF
ncbi:MAG: TonB-dependent receptor [Pseudomonadota bacterium]